ncbi:MAG: carboxymuconolactone decarboxylase family protein [Solimonas sp.]
MSRLSITPVAEAAGETAELYAALKRNIGKVPNLYATIGTHAPAVLGQVLQNSASLKKATLTPREQEAINLAVSEATGCDYCLAAHTLMAKAAGYNQEQTLALRRGAYAEDAKIDALIRFALTLVKDQGTLAAPEVEALRAAGYSERQLIEIPQTIAAILFTNMVNRINDTALDFPKAAAM